MTEAKQPLFALTTSRGFTAWLASTGASLAFTTYQGGKVLFLGTTPDGKLAVTPDAGAHEGPGRPRWSQ